MYSVASMRALSSRPRRKAAYARPEQHRQLFIRELKHDVPFMSSPVLLITLCLLLVSPAYRFWIRSNGESRWLGSLNLRRIFDLHEFAGNEENEQTDDSLVCSPFLFVLGAHYKAH
jgi:hypothetical protein